MEAPPLIIFPTIDRLELMSLPSIFEGERIKDVPFDTPLTIIEPDETSRQRVGQNNQWLRVRDPSGAEGYVAAWYTALEKPARPLDAAENISEQSVAQSAPDAQGARLETPEIRYKDVSASLKGRARGIDISRFNRKVDFKAVRQVGIDFLFIQAPGSPSTADEKRFLSQWASAKDAGLLRGAYRVFDPRIEPAQQALDFKRLLDPDIGELPPAIDLELTVSQLSRRVFLHLSAYAREMEQTWGFKPLVYARPALLEKMLRFHQEEKDQPENAFPYDYPLWVPLYLTEESSLSDPGALTQGFPWTIWQYNPEGNITGVEGKVNLNVFNSSPEELQRWSDSLQKQYQQTAFEKLPNYGVPASQGTVSGMTSAKPVQLGPLPRILLQSALLKDEKIFSSQNAHFTLALLNPSGEGERTWKRNEPWRVSAEWKPVDGRKTVIRQVERKFPGSVAPGMGYDLSVTVRAPYAAGEYQVSWKLETLDWQAVFDSQAGSTTLTVEQYQHPIDKEEFLPDQIDCLSIEPPQEVIKARKYPVEVILVNKGPRTFSSTRQMRLYLTLKRITDDYTLSDMALQPLGMDLPPGDSLKLTFRFKAPRSEGQFVADWELKPDESWHAQVSSGTRQSSLTLLPTPGSQEPTGTKPVREKLPPRGARQLRLPEKPHPTTALVYESFYRPLIDPAAQQGDVHRLDIHLNPRLSEEAPSSDVWKYQVVVTQYEGSPRNPQAYYYESPFELDERAAPMEELGTVRAGKLLFDGLFSREQVASSQGEPQPPCTLDGLRRAMALGLRRESECLRLQLRFNNQTPVVHNYRWEYLWDPQGSEGGPLATSERLPFARVLHLSASTEFAPDPLSDSQPMRMLVAVSSPAVLDQDGKRPDELAGLGPIPSAEVKALVDSLQRVGKRLRFEVLWDASLESLRQKLQDGLDGQPFQVLHLLCHGVVHSVDGQACLVLQRGSTGEADLVSDQLFARQLQPFFPSLSLVVLASCLTALSTNHLPLQGVARRLLAQTSIPAVIAMQDRLQIESAQYFAQRFYRRLVDTGFVDVAANAGRRELFDRCIKDPNHPLPGEVLPNQWGVPVLFLRLLNGQLFKVGAPVQEKMEAQARSLGELSQDDLHTVTDSLLRSAATQVGLQLSVALPNLAQSFQQAIELSRLRPAVEPAPAPRRIFGTPRQEDRRWWLVWAAALYRKHPARRIQLFTRREAMRRVARLLARERLEDVSAVDFSQALQQGGRAVWVQLGTDPLGQPLETPLFEVSQLKGSGPANASAWPEDDLSAADLSPISLHDDQSRQPLLLGSHPARSAAWRMALRGFDSYSGESRYRLSLSGNLTWDLPAPAVFSPDAYRQLLYGENPLQAFAALTQAGSLDAESAALALHAVYPDLFLPYQESHCKAVYTCLDLQDSKLYSVDYPGYCLLARDLLADTDLGLEDLVDAHLFLQRMAHGDYCSASDLKAHASGQVRPKNLRTQLRPVEIDPQQVDSDLVIRQSVLVQAAAALNAGKHIILIGPPGTGKTTLAEDLCRFAHDWDFNRGHILVTATADWTTFDTIGGYMPASGDQLVFKQGIFLEAIADEKWLVIDEINRADIDKAFGELFTVLSGQAVTLPYKSGERLVRILPSGQTASEETLDYAIPRGWRIIGTMNIYDKASLFAMSYAFMRRFAFINVPVPEPKPYVKLLEFFVRRNELSSTALPGQPSAAQTLSQLITAPEAENPLMLNRAIGPAILKDILDYLRSRTGRGREAFSHAHLAEAFNLYILPQLDGLEQDSILAVYSQLRKLFAEHTAESDVQAMFERIKELFPFVPKRSWEEKR